MSRIYILIRTQAGRMWRVRAIIQQFDSINNVHVITGPYDLIADADLQSDKSMKVLLDKIHDVEGVISTETWIAI
ncbi:MAG: Lrp/AsnC ligand binding domain-containing protein [Candidatus Thorarchaeota archaeon]